MHEVAALKVLFSVRYTVKPIMDELSQQHLPLINVVYESLWLDFDYL